ncbi:mechanosensitive ion channel domain-containing protein [Devosia sp.]|uniref:mechanosensitive ion channel domain-containing protein n=1 Tax=Devosia sp. TaxID=1871048 RepID=UPI002AFF299C|nr:mechanosensitive ion channel domain-containing protein [Devosia sp.]
MRLLLLVFLLIFTPGAFAQEAAPVADDAGISELVRIIENPETRAALVDKLKQAESGAPAEETLPPDLSIARQLAEYTKTVAEGASTTLRSLGSVFVELQHGLTGTMDADFTALRDVALAVLAVAVGLIGVFLLLRLVVKRLQRVIAGRVAGKGWLSRIFGAAMAALVDFGAVLLAWGCGYVLALLLAGTMSGRMGINQSLLLNAFLVVELSKLVVRTILSPPHEELRLLPVGDDNAAYWSFWLARIIALLAYTFFFVTPLLAANLTPGAAASVQVLVMAAAVTIGIVIVLQNRDDVRNWLYLLAAKRGGVGMGQVLRLVGQHWHQLAILYLVTLLVVWFTNPDEALPFMLGATVQSVIAIVVGTLVGSFISRAVTAGMKLPEDVKKRLPLLEGRLHAFVPHVMRVVHGVVVGGVVVTIAQAWSIFDFLGWIGSEAGQQLAGSVLSAALIVLVCIVLHVVVASWVEYRLNTTIGKAPTPREKTLLNLFKNAFTVALVIFGLMLALAQVGVNIAPLIAGAGVVGLAIGFGAQKLVQDIITGIFIQFENIMNEGDVVAVGDKSGVVEKLTIRSVTIRDLSGTVHLIPFSSVDQVSNMMRGFSFHVAEIGVAYDSDIDQVRAALATAFDRLMQTPHKDEILDELDMQGIIGFAASAVTVRARIKTLPGKQWAIGRKFNELVKAVFAEEGIEIPYPHITYVQGGEARASGRVLHAEPPRRGRGKGAPAAG